MTEDMPTGEKTVSDEQIIEAVEQHDDPVVSANEVASMFDHTRQWAHSRLNDLFEEDRVCRKNGGPRSVMWWVED